MFTEATFSRTSFILARSRRPGHPRLLQAPSQALVPSYGLSGGDGQIHDGPEAAWVLCPQEEPQLPPSRQGEAEHVQPPGAPGTHGSDVNERQRGSCPSVFVTARLCHLSLSAAAVGGESQEASAVLAVLAAVQGHEGDWWSRAVPRGARRRVESAGQVSPHSSDHDDAEREQKCFFCSWRNVFFSPPFLIVSPDSSGFRAQFFLFLGAAPQGTGVTGSQREPAEPAEPAEPQPGQRLLSGLRQQGVQPGSCPGWWGLTPKKHKLKTKDLALEVGNFRGPQWFYQTRLCGRASFPHSLVLCL